MLTANTNPSDWSMSLTSLCVKTQAAVRFWGVEICNESLVIRHHGTGIMSIIHNILATASHHFIKLPVGQFFIGQVFRLLLSSPGIDNSVALALDTVGFFSTAFSPLTNVFG